MFKQYNPNPSKKKASDCVIRALAVVTEKEWDEIFWDLAKIGFDLKDIQNSIPVWSKYLTDNGFTRTGIKATKGSKRPTVSVFAKEHPHGLFFLQIANHVVGIKDGNHYDLWDCGDCSLYAYWEKKEH